MNHAQQNPCPWLALNSGPLAQLKQEEYDPAQMLARTPPPQYVPAFIFRAGSLSPLAFSAELVWTLAEGPQVKRLLAKGF